MPIAVADRRTTHVIVRRPHSGAVKSCGGGRAIQAKESKHGRQFSGQKCVSEAKSSLVRCALVFLSPFLSLSLTPARIRRATSGDDPELAQRPAIDRATTAAAAATLELQPLSEHRLIPLTPAAGAVLQTRSLPTHRRCRRLLSSRVVARSAVSSLVCCRRRLLLL